MAQGELNVQRIAERHVHIALAYESVTARQTDTRRPIPPEILIAIAESLLDMGRIHDLAMLSLLERSLSPTIQRILFGHITLSDFLRCDRLTETLRSERTTLPLLVRRITAVLDTEYRIRGRLFLARHLTNLYMLCPMLSQVTLAGGTDGGPGEQLFPDILDLPRLGALGSVKSLTLTGPPGNFGPCLLFHLPGLRILRLFGDLPTTQFNGPSPRSGSSLRHITWGLASPPTLGLIKWLFAGSSEVIGGSLTLITPPTSLLEMERIQEYCSSRGMCFRSMPLANFRQTDSSISSDTP